MAESALGKLLTKRTTTRMLQMQESFWQRECGTNRLDLRATQLSLSAMPSVVWWTCLLFYPPFPACASVPNMLRCRV